MPMCKRVSGAEPARRSRRDTGRLLRRRRGLFMGDDDARAELATQALLASGYEVVARLSCAEDLLTAVSRVQPDVVLVDVDQPVGDMLESCAAVIRQAPRPIVLFANDGSPDTIEEAVRAGVSAYVIKGFSERRLKSILDTAILRFGEQQRLRDELEDMRLRLAERRDVELAKEILARMRKLDEAAAYALLRREAMARRITVGQAARNLLAAAQMLEAQKA